MDLDEEMLLDGENEVKQEFVRKYLEVYIVETFKAPIEWRDELVERSMKLLETFRAAQTIKTTREKVVVVAFFDLRAEEAGFEFPNILKRFAWDITAKDILESSWEERLLKTDHNTFSFFEKSGIVKCNAEFMKKRRNLRARMKRKEKQQKLVATEPLPIWVAILRDTGFTWDDIRYQRIIEGILSRKYDSYEDKVQEVLSEVKDFVETYLIQPLPKVIKVGEDYPYTYTVYLKMPNSVRHIQSVENRQS